MKPGRAIAALLLGVALCGGGMGWRWRLPAGVAPPAVPADNSMSAAKVELGRRLFYDADLSVDGTMACATCHEQKRGFADGNATRPGVHGDPGRRNVPGLANLAWQRSLTWGDPRVATLEAQMLIPLLGETPVEMGMKGKEAEIVRRLARDPCYVAMFARAFPGPGGSIDMGSVTKAVAAFERSLVALDTPYDRGTLSPAASRGSVLFRTACSGCHAGRDFSDGAFRALIAPSPSDRGLAEITGAGEDAGRFRTPGLRNIALTAPYFHDGSAPDLASAIRGHAPVVSGVAGLSGGKMVDLIAFLGALTDRAFVTDRRLAIPEKACGKVI